MPCSSNMSGSNQVRCKVEYSAHEHVLWTSVRWCSYYKPRGTHSTLSQLFLLSLNAVALRQRFGRVESYIQAAAPRQKSWMLVKSVNPLSSGLTDYSWLQLLFCITLFYNRAGYTRGNEPRLGRRPHVLCAHFTPSPWSPWPKT